MQLLLVQTTCGILAATPGLNRSGQIIGPPGSGSVTAMAQSTSDADIVYAAFEDVGVLRSSDRGLTFDTAGVASFSSHTVTCLAVNPANPDIVLAGTLEPYSHMNVNEVWLWRSTDGAKSWTVASELGYSVTGINVITFSAHNPEIVLAGANISSSYSQKPSALLRSRNGGVTWGFAPPNAFYEVVKGSVVYPAIKYSGITALVFDSSVPGRALAGFTGNDDRYNYGLYESSDFGLTWNSIPVEPFSGADASPVFTLLQVPGSPSVFLAGTSVESGTAKTRPLWKSTNSGYTWSAATPEFDSRSTTVTGFYRLACNRESPLTIWAAQSPIISRAAPYFNSWPKETALMRSDDFGESWNVVPPLLTGAKYPADTIQGMIAQDGPVPQLLVGYTGLGLWRLEATESDLHPVDGNLPFGNVTSIAEADSQLTIGLGYPINAVSPFMNGRSTGGDFEWTNSTGLPAGVAGSHVIANPLDTAHLLGVADGDLYSSENSGDTWNIKQTGINGIGHGRPGSSEVFLATTDGLRTSSDFADGSSSAGVGLDFAVPSSFSVGNSGSRVAVAAAPENGQASLGSGVFVSDDGGALFHKSNNGIPPANDLENLRWAADGMNLYGTEDDVLFHSHNAGHNWTPKPIKLPASPTTTTLIAPESVSDLQIGTARSTDCLWLLTKRAFLYRSLDDGNSWQVIEPLPLLPWFYNLEMFSHFMVDLQAMAVSAIDSKKIWVCGPREFAYSTNGGDDWTTWSRTGLPSSGIKQFAVDDQNHQRMFVSDGRGIYRSLNGGVSWTHVSIPVGTGEISQLILPKSYPQRVLAAAASGAIWFSDDDGIAWSVNSPFFSSSTVRIAVSPVDDRMYAVDNRGEGLMSTNAGQSWSLWHDAPYKGYGLRGDRLVVSPTTATELLFSQPDGTIYRSTDSMKSWSEASPDLQNSFVKSVAVNPAEENVMYAGTRGNGIYKSVNGGEAWTQCLKMIFDLSVNDIKINPSNPEECFAATDWGLLCSPDAGVIWSQFTNDLDGAEVRTIELSQTPHGTEIYAARAHGGIWTNRIIRQPSAAFDWQMYE